MLLVLHKCRDVLPEQRERWICDHNVGFLQQLQALGGAEVAVTFQLGQFIFAGLEQLCHVKHVHTTISGGVVHRGHDGLIWFAYFALIATEYVKQAELAPGNRRPGIAGGNELLEAETLEVQHKELEEVGLEGVVAVTENRLALEVTAVVPHLLLNIGELRVELVFLRRLRRPKTRVPCHGAPCLRSYTSTY